MIMCVYQQFFVRVFFLMYRYLEMYLYCDIYLKYINYNLIGILIAVIVIDIAMDIDILSIINILFLGERGERLGGLLKV